MKIKGIILDDDDVKKKGDALLDEAKMASANLQVITKNIKMLSDLNDLPLGKLPSEDLPKEATKYVKEINDTFQKYLDKTETPPIPFPFVVTGWIAAKYYLA